MADRSEYAAIVDAINDLTRVTVALHGKFASKSEAVRRLTELSIPPSRIAAILAMPVGDVSSAIAKAKRTTTKPAGGGASAAPENATND